MQSDSMWFMSFSFIWEMSYILFLIVTQDFVKEDNATNGNANKDSESAASQEWVSITYNLLFLK